MEVFASFLTCVPVTVNIHTAKLHRRHMLLLGKETEDHNIFVRMDERMLSGGSGFGAPM